MLRVGRLLAAILVAPAVAAAAHAQVIRDSAGVRIVSYSVRDRAKERWSLDREPMLEIGRGSTDGPATFSEIVGVVRLSDGRIAVANKRPSEIRLFDASGRFLGPLGRSGQGPGEFRTVLWALLRSADTLIGVDNSGRAQIFDERGNLRRSLPRARPPASRPNPSRLGLDPSGNVLVQAMEVPTDDAGPTLAYYRLLRESPDATRYDDLVRFPALQLLPERGTAPRFEVYGPSGVVATDGRHTCIGFSSVATITCYSPAGRPLLSIRRRAVHREITSADRQFFLAARLAANQEAAPDVIARITESHRLSQFAKLAPAFSRMIIALSGDVWVSEFDRTDKAIGPPAFRRPQQQLRWSIFRRDGLWLSDILTPARFLPYEIGPDYVLGTTLGSDDVEHVTMYRIRR